MASERQISANRLNSRKSTGPRSAPGKKRASHNSYRHGLSVSPSSNTDFAEQLDELARKIADEVDILFETARILAQAEFDLARVRRVKVALIDRVLAFGALDPRERFLLPKPFRETAAVLQNYICGIPFPRPPDPKETLPPREPERSAEALRRIIPELLHLERYERRARAVRDRVVRSLSREVGSPDPWK